MSKNLESPHDEGAPHGGGLYRARGEDAAGPRPIFTGDVFGSVQLPGSTGNVKGRTVIVLQHPCSMRTNGVDLAWQVLVAEVTPRRALADTEWSDGFYNLMPLPDLHPEVSNKLRHQAADFDSLYLVPPEALSTRIAALSPFGVDLLLQRWVHFNSRVVVPTHDFYTETAAFYEEADLIEEWCEEFDNVDAREATSRCISWLRSEQNGSTFQQLLKDPQSRSSVRKAMRAEVRSRRAV